MAQKKHLQSTNEKSPLHVDGADWFLAVTRNASFWHQYLSNEGHFHHIRDFGVDGSFRILLVTIDSTQSHCFMHNPNLDEYNKAVLKAIEKPQGIKKLRTAYKKYAQQLLASLDECNQNLNPQTWQSFLNVYRRFTAGLMITATIGRQGGDKLAQLLLSKGMSQEEAQQMISIITYPQEHTPLFNSHLDLLKIGEKVQKDNIYKKQIEQELQKWLTKNQHIAVNFCEEPWTKSDAHEQLNAVLLKDCSTEYAQATENHNKKIQQAQSLLKKLNNKEITILAYAIAEGTYLNEFRKNVFSQVSYNYRNIFQKIAAKAGSSNWKDLWYLTPEETIAIVNGDSIKIAKIKQNRNIVGVYITAKGTTEFISQDKLLAIKNHIDSLHGKSQTDTTVSEQMLKGQSASKGIVRGIVKIVLNSKEFGKVNADDILVTTMTSVDFIPVMKKAAAFVTNEGGITSHASIVSREMNKPCIIGTRIATQVLRDGDFVEVNADKGIVTILSRAKN